MQFQGPVFFISQNRPWKPRPLGTVLDPMQKFNHYWNNAQINQSQVSQSPQDPQVQQNSQLWYPPTPQQIWSPPYPQNSPWKSNWRNSNFANQQQIQPVPPQINNSQFPFAPVKLLMQLLPQPQLDTTSE